jgi:hypothetical protein
VLARFLAMGIALLAAWLLPGCAVKGCDDYGCSKRVSIELTPPSGGFAPGAYALSVKIPGKPHVTVACEVPATSCRCHHACFCQGSVASIRACVNDASVSIVVDGDPSEVSLTVALNGNPIADRKITPDYDRSSSDHCHDCAYAESTQPL